MMLSSSFRTKTSGLLMLICLASLLNAGVSAAAVPLEEIWQPNGPVRAVEMAKGDGANTVYIGGDFTYVGPETGNAVAVNSTNTVFDLEFAGPGPNPVGVHVSIIGANDSWYIGGNFTQVIDSNGESHDRNYLAEIDTEGNVLAWNPSVNDAVHTLLLDSANSTLYVGGEFTSVNVAATLPVSPVSQTRNYLAAFDTLTNENNVTIWNPDPNGFVYALAHLPAIPPTDARLYVGGDFTLIDNIIAPLSRNRIARLHINHVTPPNPGDYDSGWNPDVDGLVRTLAFDAINNRLYAGGDFTNVNVAANSKARSRLAVFDTTIDDDNAYPWSPSVDASVRTLGLLGDLLYIGGDFTMIDSAEWFGFSVINAADVSIASATIVAWAGNRLPFVDAVNISVRKIMFSGSLMYVASNGMHATDSRPVSRMSALDPDTGDLSWSVDTSGGVINTVAFVDGLFFIAGTFESGGGRIRSHVAELSLSTGTERGKVTNWDVFVDGPVHSIVSNNDGQEIYIGGNFSAAGPTLAARNNIALLSGSSNNILPWSASITDVGSAADAIVRTMVLSPSPDQTKLYVGGKFDQIGTESRSNIAALDTTVNGANGVDVLNDAWQPDVDGEVYALVASSDNELVYAGGDFSIVGGDFNSNVTALRAGNGRPLSIDGLWAVESVNGIVRSLTLSRDDKTLYLGGDFTEIEDETTIYNGLGFVAALDVDPANDKWRVVPTFNPVVTGSTGDIGIYSMALSTDDQMLWLGGNFSNAAGSPRNHVARYNLSEPLLTEWNPDISTGTAVYAMDRNTDDSLMVVAGEFSAVGSAPTDISRNHLAIFDTARPTVTNHVAGGFYNTSPLDVILSCAHNSTAGPCSIFYTTGGGEPTQLDNEYLYIQPPPAPPEPPPPPRVTSITTDEEIKFFAKDAHGTVSEINSVRYGIDEEYPTTEVQSNVLLQDILHGDTYKEISNTGIAIALVCEDSGGANCGNTYYTTDGSAPNNEDGTPSDDAQLYTLPLTPRQLLPLDFYTLEDLVGDEQDVFREMTLADIVNSTEQAAFRIDLDAFTLADIPDVAVARNSIDLARVFEHVDLAAIQIDSIPGNILSAVIASADIPDGAETFADLDVEDLDLTQITLGSISRTAYSLADIPASLAPPPTYITASQVPLIQVALDRSENHIVFDAVRLDTITLEQISAEFIPRTRLYGFIELQYFSIDRAGNSEASIPSPDVGVKREIYYIDIGAPETNATPNTNDNVFTSEIQVVLECYDFGDMPSGFSDLPADVTTEATGSGCLEGGTYYTIGGGLPTPSEVGTGGATQVYTGPIAISSASVLRFLSIDELGNEEVSGFEVYAFTFSSVGQSGVGTSGLMVWLLALLGLLLRWRSARTRLH